MEPRPSYHTQHIAETFGLTPTRDKGGHFSLPGTFTAKTIGPSRRPPVSMVLVEDGSSKVIRG